MESSPKLLQLRGDVNTSFSFAIRYAAGSIQSLYVVLLYMADNTMTEDVTDAGPDAPVDRCRSVGRDRRWGRGSGADQPAFAVCRA